MRRPALTWLTVVVLLCSIAALLSAQESAAPAAHGSGHVIMPPDQIKWSPGPPGLPAGAMICVLVGDPAKPGLFTFRAKMPAGFVIPPHWHSSDESVTVLSGKLNIGDGDKIDKAASTALGPGGFMNMPAKMHHFAFFEEETIIQLHGMGPFDITYINPGDDPRKQQDNKPDDKK